MSRKAPSPTNTSYSGISNYQSSNYRRAEPMPQLPDLQDGRQVARQHYEELQLFLGSHLAREPANSRSSAREKLTRLTRQQFQELSTDVYDELIRRNNNSETNEVPFLPVRDDFHPKRNQARQKLATLPKTRFKDLASDVFFELGRRYPEFKEPETPSEYPSAADSEEQPDRRQPSIDALREGEGAMRKGSAGTISSARKDSSGSNGTYMVPAAGPPDRRRPSEDVKFSAPPIRRPSEDTVRTPYARAGSRDDNLLRKSLRDSYAPSVAPSTATSGVVIPNKSTIAEEEIKVPYGTDGDDSQDYDGSDASPVRPTPNRSGSQGYGSLGTSLLNGPLSPATDDGREFYDRMSLGTASMLSNGAGTLKGREEREAAEQMRSEYEFKIATMQNRIATLESQAGGGGSSREVQDLKARLDDQANRIRALERDLEEAQADRDSVKRQRESFVRRQDGKDATIRDLQLRIDDLQSKGVGTLDPGATDDLRAEVQNLVDELRELSHRNDELMAEKAADLRNIHDLTDQLKDTKRKYERAKTELRNFKSTSGTFNVQTPRMEDSMPYADNGGILDIHVTSFQAAIDTLLSVARSNEHSNVISPMRHVVYSASSIAEDLRAFEQRSPAERQGTDDESVKLGRERIEATLSNLVAAIKNHATSHGLSPVSLVDAAASHVSSAVIGSINLVSLRKSTPAEREMERQREQAAESSGHGLGLLSAGSSPQSKTDRIRILRGADKHGRNPSDASQWSSIGGSRLGGTISDRSSNPSPQPPHTPNGGINGGSSEEGVDEAWEELKPYLDVQSESIVLPIRNLLSAIRAGAGASELDENLTQIITIVSSIVAACKDGLPAASAKQGKEILDNLSDNCNKLSELQSQGEITKQTRQAMASSSFAVAKALKELRAL